MIRTSLALPIVLLATVAATAPPKPALAPSEIVAAAPASDWADIPDSDLIVMTLGNGRTVTIQLTRDFAPIHVANIRKLVASGFWDGTSVNRVQENYVVQWGDASERKPLPAGLATAPESQYVRTLAGLPFRPLLFRDAYAMKVGHAAGWPVASDGKNAWLPHCYAMVGVGRNLSPDTGTGAELYVVNGHAPRHLDRNIAVVGRVIDGIDALTALPRGTGALGFYEKESERVPIAKVVAGSADRWQAMKTDSATFAKYIAARANRRDAFFNVPANGLDICNASVPLRRVSKN